MSRDRERLRDKRKEEKEPIIYDGIIREDCPCPKDCRRHSLCGLCREHHKKTPPYCERGAKG